MKRLDLLLVSKGLAPSRSKAQQMIAAGEVEVLARGRWRVIEQASYEAEEARLRPGGETLKYVSRGGLKLEAALEHLNLQVRGLRCFDIGLSTGGFSDCLLSRGAREVVGIDVGHGQLSPRLQNEAKLKHFAGVNVRELPPEVRALVERDVDLCVVDVSFISLGLVLAVLPGYLPAEARVLALVKPQFEVGAENLDKKGVVKDPELFATVRANVLLALGKYGFSCLDYFPCAVKGQDGNQEFFVYAARA